jgi:hypothetical protein
MAIRILERRLFMDRFLITRPAKHTLCCKIQAFREQLISQFLEFSYNPNGSYSPKNFIDYSVEAEVYDGISAPPSHSGFLLKKLKYNYILTRQNNFCIDTESLRTVLSRAFRSISHPRLKKLRPPRAVLTVMHLKALKASHM